MTVLTYLVGTERRQERVPTCDLHAWCVCHPDVVILHSCPEATS